MAVAPVKITFVVILSFEVALVNSPILQLSVVILDLTFRGGWGGGGVLVLYFCMAIVYEAVGVLQF